MVYEMCIAPDCSGKVTTRGSNWKLCNRHLDMLKFMLWTLDNLKVKDKEEQQSEQKDSTIKIK